MLPSSISLLFDSLLCRNRDVPFKKEYMLIRNTECENVTCQLVKFLSGSFFPLALTRYGLGCLWDKGVQARASFMLEAGKALCVAAYHRRSQSQPQSQVDQSSFSHSDIECVKYFSIGTIIKAVAAIWYMV